MCLELFRLLLFFHCTLMMAHCQSYPSPCPETFQYRIDRNGELYGTIGIYSFNKNAVRLNVQLSIGNRVEGYNGRIEVVNPKDEVLDDIENQRAIRYKVFFPRWDNIPPKITRISVNGQAVCSGPPIERRWIHVVTSVNLQHTLTVNELSPRPSQNLYPNNNNINKNPFLNGDGTTFIIEGDGKPILINGRKDFDVFVNPLPTTTTVRTTTKTSRKPIVVNDLLFSDNPFLNGKGSVPQPAPSTPKTPPRSSPRPFTTSTPPSSTDTCGVPVVPNPLVVNGNAVPFGAFPWLAAMFATTGTGFEYKCGGSLISPRHIVTAAHCLHQGRKKLTPDKIFLILGKLNIQDFLPTENEKLVGADDIRIHPDYKPLTSDADIAVIIISSELQYSKYIRPICLWSGNEDLDNIVGETGKVVGWGRDERNNSMSAQPKQVNLPIVSQEQCLRSSEAFKYITSSRTFCAGDRNDSGPCNGDSGSGFIMNKNGRWTLRGVVSISTYDSVKQSCDLSNYVVFTDVSKFRAWLLSIIVFI